VTRAELLAAVQRTLVESFDLDPSDVVPEARLREDLDLDSIDAIDISVRTRPLTGRKMTDEELRSLRTVEDVVDLVLRMRAP
jgi:acyl carrier protein